LSVELESYPNEQDKLLLLTGFRFGFSLQYSGPRGFSISPKKSAKEALHLVETKLLKEIALDMVAGPFTEVPFPTLRISPVGLVPKKVLPT
jgi:hypothetical protein